jgi:hypothetical protein
LPVAAQQHTNSEPPSNKPLLQPLQFSGTKPQLIMCLLSALGLAGPTPVPARELRAVALERSVQRIGDGPDCCAAFTQLVGQLTTPGSDRWPSSLCGAQYDSMAGTRRSVVAAGICSMAELRTAAAEAVRRAEARREEEAARWAEKQARLGASAEWPERVVRRSRPQPCAGACGKAYAAACPNQCCAGCCHSGRPGLLPCERHNAPGVPAARPARG